MRLSRAHSRGAYYGENLRDVTEDGVSHVMRIFLQHATRGVVAAPALRDVEQSGARETTEAENFLRNTENIVQVECDEVLLGRVD